MGFNRSLSGSFSMVVGVVCFGHYNMNNELKNRLIQWQQKAQGSHDVWVQFILYYLIFDAYISDMSNNGNNEKKLVWFFSNDSSLRTKAVSILETKPCSSIERLKELSPIRSMRPGISSEVYLNDENNLEEVFRFIYQIRCNLVHGSKDSVKSRDEELVHCATEFLKDAIDHWLE